MADVIEQKYQLTYKFNLERGDEDKTTRNVSFTVDQTDAEAAVAHSKAFVNWYMANGAVSSLGSAIQTANWRDDDILEEAWQCAGVQPIFEMSYKRYIDTNDSSV